MLINCPKCKKKFEVNQNLIPKEGRLLQCGNCNHKWYFKKYLKISKEINDLDLSKNRIQNILDQIPDDDSPKKHIKEKKIKKKKINLFKTFIVFIISLIALILIIDTFKHQISILIPETEKILNNLYETIIDIKLFIKDLI